MDQRTRENLSFRFCDSSKKLAGGACERQIVTNGCDYNQSMWNCWLAWCSQTALQRESLPGVHSRHHLGKYLRNACTADARSFDGGSESHLVERSSRLTSLSS